MPQAEAEPFTIFSSPVQPLVVPQLGHPASCGPTADYRLSSCIQAAGVLTWLPVWKLKVGNQPHLSARRHTQTFPSLWDGCSVSSGHSGACRDRRTLQPGGMHTKRWKPPSLSSDVVKLESRWRKGRRSWEQQWYGPWPCVSKMYILKHASCSSH